MFLNSVSSIGIGGVLHLPFLVIATITLAFKVNFFYSKLDRRIFPYMDKLFFQYGHKFKKNYKFTYLLENMMELYKGGSNNCKL
jgi:hypothetical protein